MGSFACFLCTTILHFPQRPEEGNRFHFELEFKKFASHRCHLPMGWSLRLKELDIAFVCLSFLTVNKL